MSGINYNTPGAHGEYVDLQQYDEKLKPSGGPPLVKRKDRRRGMGKKAFMHGFIDELAKLGFVEKIKGAIKDPKAAISGIGNWAAKNPIEAFQGVQMGQQFLANRKAKRQESAAGGEGRQRRVGVRGGLLGGI